MPAPSRPLILLSDPDPDTRTVYSAILRHLGADVLEADSAAQALDVARREPITAAVTELLYLTPDRSLLRAFSRDARTSRIRVFVVTADTRSDRLTDAAACGAIAVRLKPFPPRELATLVLGR